MSDNALTTAMVLLAITPGLGFSLVFLCCDVDIVGRVLRSKRTLIMLSIFCGLQVILQLLGANAFYKVFLFIAAAWWLLIDILLQVWPFILPLLGFYRYVRW